MSQRLGDRIWGYAGAGTPMEYSLGSVLDHEERSPCPKDSVLPKAVAFCQGLSWRLRFVRTGLIQGQERTQAPQHGGKGSQDVAVEARG